MARIPRIVVRSTSANIKSAECSAVITVGPETAAKLSKKLGREVLPGEEFDLGTIAYYNQNPLKRLTGTIRVMVRAAKSPFSKPLA